MSLSFRLVSATGPLPAMLVFPRPPPPHPNPQYILPIDSLLPAENKTEKRTTSKESGLVSPLLIGIALSSSRQCLILLLHAVGCVRPAWLASIITAAIFGNTKAERHSKAIDGSQPRRAPPSSSSSASLGHRPRNRRPYGCRSSLATYPHVSSVPIPIGNVASLSASDSSTVPARFSLLWNIRTLQLRLAWPSSVLSCRVLTVLVLDGHGQIIAQTAGYLGIPDLSQDGIMIPGIPSLRHAGLPEGQVGRAFRFANADHPACHASGHHRLGLVARVYCVQVEAHLLHDWESGTRAFWDVWDIRTWVSPPQLRPWPGYVASSLGVPPVPSRPNERRRKRGKESHHRTAHAASTVYGVPPLAYHNTPTRQVFLVLGLRARRLVEDSCGGAWPLSA
ncbi:uncharacterized protein CLUP02_03807 [Colletotrichum lupini]|uniref:Uncharacterized protein n=1 Tax=Colletotrichum lupini TaxID=145971 RepID=A0A9Q8SJI8_9PEZI|nr:uncharacterized protein CLUP02_03807 [Colletotrichum lupini]UQC78330.1 hypothetical protein CLUP02_03807 [Colletotrichum lupini]